MPSHVSPDRPQTCPRKAQRRRPSVTARARTQALHHARHLVQGTTAQTPRSKLTPPQPSCDPVRLTHEISTFPFFSLAHYPAVVADLELTSSSYIDTYNSTTGHWEQHLITTVRTIESEQRLLYKLRKSLLAGLSDDECIGLAEELALQTRKRQPSPTTPPAQLKRPLADPAEVPSAKRFYFPETYPHVYIPPPVNYMLPTQTMPITPALAATPRNTETADMPTPVGSPFHGSMNLQSPVVPTTPLYSPPSTPNTATRSFPQQPHPPLKRWPNDYTVSEIAAGFRAMDTMVAQSPTATQKAAFERVFGCRYVKSTVCRHRGVYRKADAGVRSMFEAMGNDERAVWGEFVRRVEGRVVIAKGPDDKGQDDTGQPQSVQQEQAQTADAMIAPMGHLSIQPGEPSGAWRACLTRF